MSTSHSVWRERLIAGMAAGVLVLFWFVLFDGLVSGDPLHTVQRTGRAIGMFVTGRSPSFLPALVFFSVYHFGVWIANASLVLGVVHRGEKNPSIVVPILLLSVILYVPFVGVLTMVVEIGWGSDNTLARFLLASVIGAVTVAAQAYRTHPGLVRYELTHSEDDGS